jgi:hypothetical protein
VRLALLLDSGTARPPEGAGAFKVTVHCVFPGALIVSDVQVSPDGATFSEIAPVDVGEDTAMELPRVEDTAIAVIWTEIGFVDGLAAIWNVATATVPSAITVVFMPSSKHLDPAHEMDFPAAVADAPATTDTPVTPVP